jgi:acyl-coenzyme A synthetase/AMP-(fatty) acid ligase
MLYRVRRPLRKWNVVLSNGSKSMPISAALLSNEQRYRLKLNPDLGAGNFLNYACTVNASRELPLIHGDEPVVLPGGNSLSTLSILQLKVAADTYASWYASRGIMPMDPVAVYCRENLQYLIQYAALTSLGAIPILTNGAMVSEVAAAFFARVGAVAIVTDRDHQTMLAPHIQPDQLKFFVCMEEIADPGLPARQSFRHDHDDPVMITHSSGTTGVPKAVMLQHGRWFHGIRHLLGLEMAQGADTYLSSLPASHNASIAYAIHAILSGSALVIMADRSGRAVAEAIERFRPTTIVSFPKTYVELAELDLDQYDLGSVTTWINSGDAAHEAHIRRLVAHGYHYRGVEKVPGSQFVDGLGSSEMGHSYFRVIHTRYTDTYDRCVGLPQSWVDVCIFDDYGEPVPAGVIGRLAVRSPSVTPGYWNDSVLTYKSRMHGYWLTGDLVYRDSLACYYHVDRTSDVIQTESGPLYSLQTEELILKHQPDVIDCTVIGIEASGSDGIRSPVVLVAARQGKIIHPEAMLAEINAMQAGKCRPLLAELRVVDRRDIPLGVTGKVLKRSLREQSPRGAASA